MRAATSSRSRERAIARQRQCLLRHRCGLRGVAGWAQALRSASSALFGSSRSARSIEPWLRNCRRARALRGGVMALRASLYARRCQGRRGGVRQQVPAVAPRRAAPGTVGGAGAGARMKFRTAVLGAAAAAGAWPLCKRRHRDGSRPPYVWWNFNSLTLPLTSSGLAARSTARRSR
jgi:hypothetical protein